MGQQLNKEKIYHAVSGKGNNSFIQSCTGVADGCISWTEWREEQKK